MKHLLLLILLLISTNIFAGTVVVIKTSMGVIEVELLDKKAPETVRNFLQYTDDGFYSGVIFHRVIKDYIIQAGLLTTDFKEKDQHPQIKNEALNMIKNLKGTISMARRRHKHSAKSEFFFNLKDNPELDHQGLGHYGYSTFGKITKGFDVALKIGGVPVERKGQHKRVPLTPVVIESVKRK